MGKVSRLFVCEKCDRPSAQWSGRCSSCGSWGTVTEHPVGSARREGLPVAAPVLSLVPDSEEHRISTGFPAVDRVLGGGLVRGSVVLLAGAPGIGKSTLLLQLASRLAEAGHLCLLASGEEARNQVAVRARRLHLGGAGVSFTPGRDLDEVLVTSERCQPDVLIVDSVQTIRSTASEAVPGGVSQVRACADALIGLAKKQGTAVVLVGHVTKDGDLAGPRTLEHAVDAVLTFEGDSRSGRRILGSGKNRFGTEGETAWFEMTATGLHEVEPGIRLGDGRAEPGSATALALAGRRAFAVDVQALAVPSEGPFRRQVTGLDPRRFQIVAAITDRARKLGLNRTELYGAAAGGLRLDDPGADLAIAAALASARLTRPLPRAGFVGELSLTGSLRPVSGLEQRLAAATAADLSAVVVPVDGPTVPLSIADRLELVPVGHVREALEWALKGDAEPVVTELGM